ncbi:MAG: N-acetylneuraminate synthase family protein [Lachnospiraceae bacterium]|nr:N-acetylneuraminate synthase family protein [Lachnospiraceae bacterium]MDE7201686.1 N-acetylneuraminate synthase family protein [Lachnospiraceae bacterium]
MELCIGNIKIGKEYTPLVIPEIGINHGGNLKVAMKMVDAAYAAGARLVKHQTHVIEDEMSPKAKDVIPGNSEKSIYDVMAECALCESDERELKEYVESLGMEFLSTPFSRAAAERLERMDVKAYKIGSGELNNYPLLRHIAEFRKPMIISTGMNGISNIRKAIEIVNEYNTPFALLHTTNLYPTKPHQVRLGAMQEMMQVFPDALIGLSDHTLNNNACIAAIALGGCIVERHFTDSKDRIGNDIICSMDGKELKDLLQAAKEIWMMRGGSKQSLPEEQVTIDFAFATIVSIADIQQGELLTKDNIWVKRPGIGGILAEEYENILGRRAKVDIPKDVHLCKAMID